MRRPNAIELFQAGMLVLLLASAIQGVMTLSSAMTMKSRASSTLEELRTFELGFKAANAIVEEREPFEAALSQNTVNDPVWLDQLARWRSRTDLALDHFERRAKDTGIASAMNFNFLRAQLKTERARGDALLAMPLTQRSVGLRMSVVRGMISASETIVPMLSIVSRRIEVADPNIGGKIAMVRLLASLNDSAVRLPSEVLPFIAAGTTLPSDAQMQALRIIQRIYALWDVGGAQIVPAPDSDELIKAGEALRAAYFGKALPYISRQIERAASGYSRTLPPAQQIYDIYEPATKLIAGMRDLYLERMTSDAKAFSSQATMRMTVSLLLTALILTLLPILAWNTFRQVLRPLLAFRQEILSISERRITDSPVYTGSVPQVSSLFRALETLKERERERIVLDAERAALSERLRLLSVTDELTGLLNRRGFDAARDSGPPRSLAQTSDVALLALDIDHFKRVNDTYGHKAGDLVLQAISRVLDTEVGLNGIVARYGGEEFVVLLWNGELVETQMLTERLRARIERTAVPIGEGHGPLRVTASFGVAFAAREGVDWTALHEYADEALYAAKAAGRNRVRITNRIVSKWSDSAKAARRKVEPSSIVNRS